MSNILFISYDGMTDPLGQSQVIPYLAGLSRHGYQFTILSCEKKERYFLHKDEIEKLLKSFAIKWFPIFYHKKPQIGRASCRERVYILVVSVSKRTKS